MFCHLVYFPYADINLMSSRMLISFLISRHIEIQVQNMVCHDPQTDCQKCMIMIMISCKKIVGIFFFIENVTATSCYIIMLGGANNLKLVARCMMCVAVVTRG